MKIIYTCIFASFLSLCFISTGNFQLGGGIQMVVVAVFWLKSIFDAGRIEKLIDNSKEWEKKMPKRDSEEQEREKKDERREIISDAARSMDQISWMWWIIFFVAFTTLYLWFEFYPSP